MSSNTDAIRDLAEREYKWGFITDIEEDRVPKGLNEETIRLISAKKNEPEFMLQWRLKAYRHWASLERAQAEPKWANIKYPPIDYQEIVYYSAPKRKPSLKNLEEIDPEILRTYEKLGIPLAEQKKLAGRRCGRCVRQRFRRHHIQGKIGGNWRHLLPVLRSSAESSRACAEISRLRRPL